LFPDQNPAGQDIRPRPFAAGNKAALEKQNIHADFCPTGHGFSQLPKKHDVNGMQKAVQPNPSNPAKNSKGHSHRKE
jgi:hypothetical protein